MEHSPSTPASRRATWREDALRVVGEFQAHARGEGRESFPPWRIGYMAGLADVRETPTAFTATAHRVEPRERHHPVSIPRTGRPGAALVDDLCWHLEQDVRLHGLDDHYDRDDLENRLPAGPLLVDALLATILANARVDEYAIGSRILDAEGFGHRVWHRVTVAHREVAGTELAGWRNEIHSRLDLRWAGGATWRRGHLTLPLGELPETTLIAARGRLLSELVDHDLVRRSAPIRITAITPTKDGRHVVATDAADPERMQPIAATPRRVAA